MIGLFTLSTVLGIPWSWYRLSVAGSVTYELTAAEMVADGMGFSSVGDMAANADYHAFGAVMFVMSICILAGILVNLFAVEKIQKGMSNYKKKKGDWGSVMNSCFSGNHGRVYAADLCLRLHLCHDFCRQRPDSGSLSLAHEAV